MDEKIKIQLSKHKQEVLRGAGIAFAVKGIGACAGIAFNIVLGRQLGPSGTGIFNLALMIVTIAAILSRCGFDNVLLKIISSNYHKNKLAEVKGAFYGILRITFFCSILISTIIILLAPWLSKCAFNKAELSTPLRILALSIPFFSIMYLIAQALKGLKIIGVSQLLQTLLVPMISVLLFLLCGRYYNVTGAATCYVIATAIAALIGSYYWSVYSPDLTKITPQFSLRKNLGTSIPLLQVTLINICLNWAGIFLLGIWGSNNDLGIFSVAAKTSMLISFILMSINTIVAPKFAETYSNGDLETLQKTAQFSTLLLIITATPILICTIIFSKEIMGIYGSEFSDGANILIILSVGQFINVVTGSVGMLLIMCGFEKAYRKNNIIIGISTIVLHLILVPMYGINGAAISTAISVGALNIGLFYQVKTKIKISTSPIRGIIFLLKHKLTRLKPQ